MPNSDDATTEIREGRGAPVSDDERQALARVLQAVATHQRAGEAYRAVASELRALLGAATVAVGLTHQPDGPVDFVAVAGRDPREIVGLRVAAEDTLSVGALRLGQACFLRPDDRSAVRNGAIAPMVTASGVRGAVYAVDKEDGRAFADSDLAVMTVFAHAAALVAECDRYGRDLSEKQRELAVLYESARTVTSSLNIQAVLDSVLNAICHHVTVQAAVLYLLNDERTHLFIAADRGLSDDEREVQLAADAGTVAQVLGGSQALMLPDTAERSDLDIASGPRTRSAMAAPIRGATDVMGLLMVTSAEPDAYGPDELRLLGAVASQAGIAMENATLFEDATRRAEAASALYGLSQRIGSTLDVGAVLDYVADNATGLLQVDRFAVMLLDHRDGRLHPQAVRGLDPETFGRITPRPGEGIPGWVYAWTAPTAVADVAADARDRLYPIHQEGICSCMCVPMASGDNTLGVIMAMSSRRRLFTVSELELLYTIANQAAAAALNAMNFSRAKARAHAMRRYFRRFAEAMGAAVDPGRITQLVTDVALEVMQADRCAIYAVRNDVLRVAAESRLTGCGPPQAEIAVGEGLTGWVASRGRSLVVPSLSEDPRTGAHTWAGREPLASYVGLPLKSGRRTTGVLELMTREPRAFAPDEVQLLSQILSRARIGERLQEDAAI
jgi:GAF domain-containing protein